MHRTLLYVVEKCHSVFSQLVSDDVDVIIQNPPSKSLILFIGAELKWTGLVLILIS